jgi:hypothetical protein
MNTSSAHVEHPRAAVDSAQRRPTSLPEAINFCSTWLVLYACGSALMLLLCFRRRQHRELPVKQASRVVISS